MGIATTFLVDTLAAFCIVISPHNQTDLLWSQWGGQIIRSSTIDLEFRDTIFVDSSENLSRVTNILFHPTNPEIIFAGGLMMKGIYRSTDMGNTWNIVHTSGIGQEWYGGESVVACQNEDGSVKIVAASLTNGILLVSEDNGERWVEYSVPLVSSACSVSIVRNSPLIVAIGTKDGRIVRYDVSTHTSNISWQNANVLYTEVPRIVQSNSNSSDFYAITVGHDTTGSNYGLLYSNDSGRSFTPHSFAGVSLWAIAQTNFHNLILGGFSEFSAFSGAGVLAELLPSCPAIKYYVLGTEWSKSMPSVWDVEAQLNKGKVTTFYVASEAGVFGVEYDSRFIKR